MMTLCKHSWGDSLKHQSESISSEDWYLFERVYKRTDQEQSPRIGSLKMKYDFGNQLKVICSSATFRPKDIGEGEKQQQSDCRHFHWLPTDTPLVVVVVASLRKIWNFLIEFSSCE
ncbi:hypothetical protein CRM22_003068 [Opisthorchis felineus]|uniref:Uncharacterized protein n=1 Tax=Opisthorchis felineus TaxID=147828 RepID=A0A4S2M9B4_OPIFE|nr:hypothetical protein CRM22_003068 [Opisthorchis felineus]